MAITTSVLKTCTSHEEPISIGSTTSANTSPSTNDPRQSLHHRRRHSSYQPRSWGAEYDDLHLMVDRFLTELGKRLEFLEAYDQFSPDSSISRAYSNFCRVRDSCAYVSDEMLDAGRRRAKILVDTLEEQYKGALARKETMEQRVQECIAFVDSQLGKYEAAATAIRDSQLAAATELLDEGWRRMDSSLNHARGVVDDAKSKARYARKVLGLKVEYAIQRAREHGLIRYEDLPDPWRVNPHILRGYRFHESPLECARSLLGLSNESFNIWSHLLGLILVLAVAFYFYPSSTIFSKSTKADIAIAAAFFLAACKCLVCSTIWHTMSSISSQSLLERFACVDYTGISLLVATSILTTEYTAFYCEPISRWTYMLTTLALGILGTLAPWHPLFNRADMAWLRVAFYVGLGATGFVPIVQLSLTRGLAWAFYFYAPIAKSIAVYLTGAILYASKMPERWFPGWFDYVGGSHNIWHIAVLGGILFHYMAMQEFFVAAFLRAGTEQCSAY